MKYFEAHVDEKLMREWANDLRNGGFNQAEKVLYDPYQDAFCCLGVLGLRLGLPKEKMSSNELLDDLSAKPDYIKEEKVFSGWNDEDKYSFEEIAHLIEEDLS